LEGVETVFLARHGRHHQFLPREVPYRANLWAMRSLGVRWFPCPPLDPYKPRYGRGTWWCPINSSTAPSSVHQLFLGRDVSPM
jgi:hypothetical protein